MLWADFKEEIMAKKADLCNCLGIDKKEIHTRKDYLEFTEEDVNLLKDLKSLIGEHADTIVEKFYKHLTQHKETKMLLKDKNTVKRLKMVQRGYLSGLFGGQYDDVYFNRRLKIGKVHNDIRLLPRWYIGAYSLYHRLIYPLIFKEYKSDIEGLLKRVLAVDKLTNLDIQLAMDMYIHTYINNLKSTTDETRLFQYIINSTVDSIVVTDLNSKIMYVNPGFERITGYSIGEVFRKDISIFCECDCAQVHEEMRDSLSKNGYWTGEVTCKRKNDEQWTSFLTISLVKDEKDNPIAYVRISRDVTEKKALEARISTVNIELEKANRELKEAQNDAILMLSVACEAKDEDTGDHVQRIQHYTRALANEIGLPAKVTEQIAYSSMLHDVGKIHIPDYILRKPGRLTTSEFEIMKMHTVFGERILLEKPYYQLARQIARGHHENYDGTGYPDALKGEDIPLAARISKLADVYDALNSKRPYKDAWSEQEAYEMILSMKGKQIDPLLVDAFKRLWENNTLKKIKVKYS